MKIILTEYLKSIGKSEYWLSQKTGISNSTICNLCNNKTKRVDFQTLEHICNVLECTPNDILILENKDLCNIEKKNMCNIVPKN